MEKKKLYYPKMDGDYCLESCKIGNKNYKGFLTMMNSLACIECENNMGHGKNKKGGWIKCNRLDAALGRDKDICT